MMARYFWTLLCIALFVTLSYAANVRVVDGDTIVVGQTTYRIEGIDAPEYGQKCATGAGKTWPCGREAVAAMEDLVLNANVTCEDHGLDDYGRTLGTCFADGVDVGEAMIRQGLAWAFRRYSDTYSQLEDKVKTSRVGVWQAETETPWDYRARQWAVAEQQAPEGCPIKGNISKNGRIYHAPWSPWYSRTKVSLEKGERWFCNEADAVAAGWRAPYWGR